MSPWPLGRPRSPEVKQRISRTLKEFYKDHEHPAKGTPPPFKGKHHSEETKLKLSRITKQLMKDPDYRKRSAIAGGKIRGEAMKSKPRPERVRRKIANAHRGKTYSKERREKMRKTALNLKDIKGHEGGPEHRRLVKKIAASLEKDGNKVVVETSVKLEKGWRIPDILVNDKFWYEIGSCSREKIRQLKNYGYEVIHLPYSGFEEGD